MYNPKTLHIAIPAMNEAEWLPVTLHHIMEEDTHDVRIWICVNQPEAYRNDPAKSSVCENNQKTLDFLNDLKADNLHVLDRSSHGNGWTGKRHGVGQARKVLMDAINKNSGADDLIVSMDADTTFDPGYLASIRECFAHHEKAIALSNPYYHKLSGDNRLDRAMLRYEIYMRHYAVNMWRIGSPYNFTALGSAIAVPIRAYRKAGGITAKKSGEDFYFLQKLRKTGWICNYNTHNVYPGTRFSDRVFFGTGPALIKGSQGDWKSYPIYSHKVFNRIKDTIDCFPKLYREKPDTPMSSFLAAQFREKDPFEPLRQNASGRERFVHACHEKVDGLRSLQFLKTESAKLAGNDEQNLKDFFKTCYPEILAGAESEGKFQEAGNLQEDDLNKLDFQNSPVPLLDTIRNVLRDIEYDYQKKDAYESLR